MAICVYMPCILQDKNNRGERASCEQQHFWCSPIFYRLLLCSWLRMLRGTHKANICTTIGLNPLERSTLKANHNKRNSNQAIKTIKHGPKF